MPVFDFRESDDQQKIQALYVYEVCKKVLGLSIN